MTSGMTSGNCVLFFVELVINREEESKALQTHVAAAVVFLVPQRRVCSASCARVRMKPQRRLKMIGSELAYGGSDNTDHQPPLCDGCERRNRWWLWWCCSGDLPVSLVVLMMFVLLLLLGFRVSARVMCHAAALSLDWHVDGAVTDIEATALVTTTCLCGPGSRPGLWWRSATKWTTQWTYDDNEVFKCFYWWCVTCDEFVADSAGNTMTRTCCAWWCCG